MGNFNQRISREIEPDDSLWRSASPALRVEFFREAAGRAVDLKRAELARGIGSNGRRMARRKHPRADGAGGPVLTPHDDASRTSRLMAGHGDFRGMTLFWRSGHGNAQRLPWGTILGFHAAGEVPGAPVRDVRLSKRGINELRDQMARWWAQKNRKAVEAERAARRAADDAELRRASRGIVARTKRALTRRYPSLKPYLEPKGGGF